MRVCYSHISDLQYIVNVITTRGSFGVQQFRHYYLFMHHSIYIYIVIYIYISLNSWTIQSNCLADYHL